MHVESIGKAEKVKNKKIKRIRKAKTRETAEPKGKIKRGYTAKRTSQHLHEIA